MRGRQKPVEGQVGSKLLEISRRSSGSSPIGARVLVMAGERAAVGQLDSDGRAIRWVWGSKPWTQEVFWFRLLLDPLIKGAALCRESQSGDR